MISQATKNQLAELAPSTQLIEYYRKHVDMMEEQTQVWLRRIEKLRELIGEGMTSMQSIRERDKEIVRLNQNLKEARIEATESKQKTQQLLDEKLVSTAVPTSPSHITTNPLGGSRGGDGGFGGGEAVGGANSRCTAANQLQQPGQRSNGINNRQYTMIVPPGTASEHVKDDTIPPAPPILVDRDVFGVGYTSEPARLDEMVPEESMRFRKTKPVANLSDPLRSLADARRAELQKREDARNTRYSQSQVGTICYQRDRSRPPKHTAAASSENWTVVEVNNINTDNPSVSPRPTQPPDRNSAPKRAEFIDVDVEAENKSRGGIGYEVSRSIVDGMEPYTTIGYEYAGRENTSLGKIDMLQSRLDAETSGHKAEVAALKCIIDDLSTSAAAQAGRDAETIRTLTKRLEEAQNALVTFTKDLSVAETRACRAERTAAEAANRLVEVARKAENDISRVETTTSIACVSAERRVRKDLETQTAKSKKRIQELELDVVHLKTHCRELEMSKDQTIESLKEQNMKLKTKLRNITQRHASLIESFRRKELSDPEVQRLLRLLE